MAAGPGRSRIPAPEVPARSRKRRGRRPAGPRGFCGCAREPANPTCLAGLGFPVLHTEMTTKMEVTRRAEARRIGASGAGYAQPRPSSDLTWAPRSSSSCGATRAAGLGRGRAWHLRVLGCGAPGQAARAPPSGGSPAALAPGRLLSLSVRPTPKPFGQPWAPEKSLAELLGRGVPSPSPIAPLAVHACAHGFVHMNTKVSSWTMCGTVYAHSARVCLDTRTAGVRGSRLLSTEDASDCSPPLPLEGEDSTGPVPVGELAIRTEDAGCLARCPPSPQWLAPSLWPLPYSVSSDSSMLRSRRECGQQGRGGSKAFRRNLEAAPTEANPRNTPSVNSSRDFAGLKPNFQLSVNLWICGEFPCPPTLPLYPLKPGSSITCSGRPWLRCSPCPDGRRHVHLLLCSQHSFCSSKAHGHSGLVPTPVTPRSTRPHCHPGLLCALDTEPQFCSRHQCTQPRQLLGPAVTQFAQGMTAGGTREPPGPSEGAGVAALTDGLPFSLLQPGVWSRCPKNSSHVASEGQGPSSCLGAPRAMLRLISIGRTSPCSLYGAASLDFVRFSVTQAHVTSIGADLGS
nr:uncharacterized protein LOC105728087 [Aotus nancymaae]